MTTRLGKGDTIFADVRTLPRRSHTYEDGLRSLTPLNHPFEKQISPGEATRRWRITRERASVDTRRRRDHSPSSATSNPCRAAPLENRGGKKRKPPRCCNCFRQQGLTRKRRKKAKRSRRRLAKASRRWLIGHYRFWFATEIGVRPSVCVDMQPRLLIKKKKKVYSQGRDVAKTTGSDWIMLDLHSYKKFYAVKVTGAFRQSEACWDTRKLCRSAFLLLLRVSKFFSP